MIYRIVNHNVYPNINYTSNFVLYQIKAVCDLSSEAAYYIADFL